MTESPESTASEVPPFLAFNTPSCGVFKVFIQGDLEKSASKTIFLTCHDIGANHTSFYSFVGDSSMAEVRKRSVFLHLCLPGQDEGEPNLNAKFPTFEAMGNEMAYILNELEVQAVVGIGDGVGANIMTHFANLHPNRCYGVILIRLSPAAPSRLNALNYKYLQWRGASGMSEGSWAYLVEHRFGKNVDDGDEVVESLKQEFNWFNLSRYMNSYFHRSDLTDILKHFLKIEVLLIVGELSIMRDAVCSIYHSMKQNSTQLLVIDNVADVLDESPEKLARALILFCKGCSLLSGVTVPTLGHHQREKKSPPSTEKST